VVVRCLEGAVGWLWGDQGIGFLIGFCFFVSSPVLFWSWFLLSLVCSLHVLCDLAWSAGRSVIVRDVRSLSHAVVFMDHLFADGPHFWDFGVVFVVAVLQL